MGPYKEGIQQEIRRHLTTDGKDLGDCLEFTIDLDEGNEEWMYIAFLNGDHKEEEGFHEVD